MRRPRLAARPGGSARARRRRRLWPMIGVLVAGIAAAAIALAASGSSGPHFSFGPVSVVSSPGAETRAPRFRPRVRTGAVPPGARRGGARRQAAASRAGRATVPRQRRRSRSRDAVGRRRPRPRRTAPPMRPPRRIVAPAAVVAPLDRGDPGGRAGDRVPEPFRRRREATIGAAPSRPRSRGRRRSSPGRSCARSASP